MNLDTQKRIASRVLKCSKKRVFFNPMYASEISEAITTDDMRDLIKRGIVVKKQKTGVSRARAKFAESQKKKGRRRGHGNRKGRKTARTSRKRSWVIKIRNQRALIRYLLLTKTLEEKMFREFYGKVKGGFFRSRRHILIYLRDNGYDTDFQKVLAESKKLRSKLLNKEARKTLKL